MHVQVSLVSPPSVLARRAAHHFAESRFSSVHVTVYHDKALEAYDEEGSLPSRLEAGLAACGTIAVQWT